MKTMTHAPPARASVAQTGNYLNEFDSNSIGQANVGAKSIGATQFGGGGKT